MGTPVCLVHHTPEQSLAERQLGPSPKGHRVSQLPEYYPKAEQGYLGRLRGRPEKLSANGVTVHYTADRDVNRTIAALGSSGLGYHIMIDRCGRVLQLVPFSSRMYHAGNARWRQLSPNRSHVAVSLVSWGKVKVLAPGAYVSWSGHTVPTDDVIEFNGAHWDKATKAQLVSLVDILIWFCQQGIDVDDMCGHDECAVPAGRKDDPGGILGRSMKDVRDALKRRLRVEPITKFC